MYMRDWAKSIRKAGKTMPILSFPSVSLLGITVSELISDPKLQAKGMKAVADRVPSAASVSMMDLSVEAEAFGSQVKVSDIEVPTVVGAVVTSEEEADALEVPEVGAGRTGLYIEAISNVCKMVDDRPVFAGVIGPFSLAGRLLDVTEALVYCYTEPDMVHTVMRKVTDFLHKYIDAYKQVGASGVVMAEPLTGILSPQLAVEFSEPYVRELVEAAQTDDFIVIYHNCGNNTIQMIDSILRVGAAAYHFGNSIKMADMMEKIPSDIVAMGNIDPAGQFRNGTPESIRAATLELMEELYPKYENFVISSGCDIPPASPWENIDAYFAAVAEYHEKYGM
ncbi:MAG: uroporphyrinogen decarboxylase family protein [Eubacteriales bacterium]|jgi:uroporphyrinogen decarboxylase|nr:methyltransferase [Clostridiales bacterium]